MRRVAKLVVIPPVLQEGLNSLQRNENRFRRSGDVRRENLRQQRMPRQDIQSVATAFVDAEHYTQ